MCMCPALQVTNHPGHLPNKPLESQSRRPRLTKIVNLRRHMDHSQSLLSIRFAVLLMVATIPQSHKRVWGWITHFCLNYPSGWLPKHGWRRRVPFIQHCANVGGSELTLGRSPQNLGPPESARKLVASADRLLRVRSYCAARLLGMSGSGSRFIGIYSYAVSRS